MVVAQLDSIFGRLPNSAGLPDDVYVDFVLSRSTYFRLPNDLKSDDARTELTLNGIDPADWVRHWKSS
jgi:hypothetical protein